MKTKEKKSLDDVIVCPACKKMSANRLHRKCRHCGVDLIYADEGMDAESEGYVYMLNGWARIKDVNY